MLPGKWWPSITCVNDVDKHQLSACLHILAISLIRIYIQVHSVELCIFKYRQVLDVSFVYINGIVCMWSLPKQYL